MIGRVLLAASRRPILRSRLLSKFVGLALSLGGQLGCLVGSVADIIHVLYD